MKTFQYNIEIDDIKPRHNDDIIVSVNNSEYTFKRYDQFKKKVSATKSKI